MLLAAGFGRRFGGDKRRHALADGRPLLISSLDLYGDVFSELIVVLRPEDATLAAAVEARPVTAEVRVTFCPDADLGMGHSLACGARGACRWRYLFVALADMPWVGRQTLDRLLRAMQTAGDDAVVQPVYQGTPGHPVGFGAAHFPRLAALTGDSGARTLLCDPGVRLLRIDVDDPGVLQDLDLPPA